MAEEEEEEEEVVVEVVAAVKREVAIDEPERGKDAAKTQAT